MHRMSKTHSPLRRILVPTALLLAVLGVTACGSDPAPATPAGAKENTAGGAGGVGGKATTTTEAPVEVFPPVVEDTTTSSTMIK